MLMELNNDNFESTLKSGITVVDFWAAWCGPCRLLSPIMDEIGHEVSDITIGKLNVDENPELAGKHGVMSIPMLMFFKDGELKDTSIGVVSKNVILNKINALR